MQHYAQIRFVEIKFASNLLWKIDVYRNPVNRSGACYSTALTYVDIRGFGGFAKPYLTIVPQFW